MGSRVPAVAGRRLVALGAMLGVALLLPAAPAAAHNSLTGSDPRNGARIAAPPERIQLSFLSRLDPATTKITVTGPDNVAASGGAPTYNGSRVSVPFRAGAAGLYIVDYQVTSGDGHPIKGEVRFTLTTGTAAEPPTSAPAGSPSAASPTPGAAVSPAAPLSPETPASPVAADEQAGDEATSWWPWALGGLALVAALGGGGALLARRRARTRPGDQP